MVGVVVNVQRETDIHHAVHHGVSEAHLSTEGVSHCLVQVALLIDVLPVTLLPHYHYPIGVADVQLHLQAQGRRDESNLASVGI